MSKSRSKTFLISETLFCAAEILDDHPPTRDTVWNSPYMILWASRERFKDDLAIKAHHEVKSFYVSCFAESLKNFEDLEAQEHAFSILKNMNKEELDELHNSRVMRLILTAEIALDLNQ